MLRTHTCGELTAKDNGKSVTLSGWVHRRRDHGGLIFLDLRDRYGFTQVVCDPENKAVFDIADKVRPEWVLQIEGTVRKRIAGAERDDNITGHIEVVAGKLAVFNEAKTPPFEIDQERDVHEDLRLEYRYLDLRRERMRHNIMLRHECMQLARRFFADHGFIEVETPILIKGTPEGAREYVVPSRLQRGQFYVLPQSPQQLKQMLMVAGFDRYMQIARCFRDEDQRGDRQPEFTQLDLEMSFVTAEDVMQLNEEALTEIVKKIRPDAALHATPFPRLTYDDAMNLYGSDKPDLRYDLTFADVTELCRGSGFAVFAGAVKNGGVVKALRVPGGATFSRKDIDDLTEVAKIYGAKGLAWIKRTDKGFEGVPASKLGDELTQKIVDETAAEAGDIILFAADTVEVACPSLGAVRIDVARRQKLIPEKTFAFCWVTDFPMFERDKDTGALVAMHHPFTRPQNADVRTLETDPLAARAEAYDIVLNGYEIGGGSIRIHEEDLQKAVFRILNIDLKEAEARFGHMLTAFRFGAPPHGGIAWGFDRLTMLLCGEPNIREVIAFPKDQHARDLLLGAPSAIPPKQLDELGISVEEE